MRRRPDLGSEPHSLVTVGGLRIGAPPVHAPDRPVEMLKEILARRVLIVLGKGGVGKTTVSAAIAKLATLSGARALVMECDARAPLAAVFGVEPSFDPKNVAPNLSLMTLDGRSALEEYLRLVVPSRMLLKAVFASRLYQFFVQAAPGLRELMMLGKIYYEAERKAAKPPHRTVIIVDAPASGQAMSLLKMPTAARTTFADSVVGKEANNISRMLRDRRHCAIVQVTTADALSVSETIETHAELTRIHLAPVAVLFNRMVAPDFDADDIAAMMNRRGPRNRKRNLEHLAELAESELRRVSEARKAIAAIRTATGGPVIELAEHRNRAGTELIESLAADLARNGEIEVPEIHTQ
jgi:arsenite-transporting ATPase